VLVAAAGLAVLAAAGLVFFWTRSRESAAVTRLDQVLAETARTREASQSIDRRFEDLRRSMDTRVEGIEKRVAAGQQSFADHLGKSTHLLEQVGERLGRLHEASQKIEKLAGGFTFTEGPVWRPEGAVWFSDVVGNVVRVDLAVDLRLSHAAGDELRVLRPEVEDEDLLVLPTRPCNSVPP